jgi:hypothetical protein
MAMSLASLCFVWPAVCSKRGLAVRSSHYLRAEYHGAAWGIDEFDRITSDLARVLASK